MRGQLLLGEKRWKERRDLARPDETSSVAYCFVSWVFLSFSLQNFRSVSPAESPGPPPRAAGEKRRRDPAPQPPARRGPARLPSPGPPQPAGRDAAGGAGSRWALRAGEAAGGSGRDGDMGGCSSFRVPACPSPHPFISGGWASRRLLGIIQRQGPVCRCPWHSLAGKAALLPSHRWHLSRAFAWRSRRHVLQVKVEQWAKLWCLIRKAVM